MQRFSILQIYTLIPKNSIGVGEGTKAQVVYFSIIIVVYFSNITD